MAAIIWRKNRIYVNDVDYVGLISEAKIELKRSLVELKGLGMPAPIKAPNGRFEEITATLKWDSISPREIRRIINDDGYLNMRLMGQCFLPDVTAGKVAHDQMRSRISGWTEQVPLPSTNIDHKSEVEMTIHVLLVDVSDNSGRLLLIDNANGIVEPASFG